MAWWLPLDRLSAEERLLVGEWTFDGKSGTGHGTPSSDLKSPCLLIRCNLRAFRAKIEIGPISDSYRVAKTPSDRSAGGRHAIHLRPRRAAVGRLHNPARPWPGRLRRGLPGRLR